LAFFVRTLGLLRAGFLTQITIIIHFLQAFENPVALFPSARVPTILQRRPRYGPSPSRSKTSFPRISKKPLFLDKISWPCKVRNRFL